jgi:lysophosphatidylcholine acyltransferase/lyso-PAF acetyltransferase
MAAAPAYNPVPFQRFDLYGDYALNPLSTGAKLRLYLMYCTIVPVKSVACIGCTLTYYVICLLGNAVLREPYRSTVLVFWGKFWTRALLYSLGYWRINWLYVSPDGLASKRKPSTPAGIQAALGGYVSNHSR